MHKQPVGEQRVSWPGSVGDVEGERIVRQGEEEEEEKEKEKEKEEEEQAALCGYGYYYDKNHECTRICPDGYDYEPNTCKGCWVCKQTGKLYCQLYCII